MHDTVETAEARDSPSTSLSAPVSAPAGSQLDLVSLALLQLCFDESEFTPPAALLGGENGAVEEDFNPHTFVASKLEHVPIDSLEKDLALYARHLEAQVLKCVQEEVYEAFIEVSGQLVTAEQPIRRVHAPLVELEARVSKCRATIAAERQAALELFDRAATGELQRALYSVSLESMLLHNTIASYLAARPEPPSDVKTLDFLCATLVRLNYLVSHVRTFPIVDDEQAKTIDDLLGLRKSDAAAVRDVVASHFVQVFASFASNPSAAESRQAIGDAAALYRQLQDEAALVELFKDRVVRPVVEDVISWRAAGNVKASINEAEKIFTRLIEVLDHAVFASLPVLQARLGDNVTFLASAVWPAIADTLMKRLTHLFAPGLPAAFHKSFTVGCRLVTALEAACRTPQELIRLRSSAEMELWRSKWNLEVYHQMRKGELEQRLKDGGVLDSPFTSTTKTPDPFSIPQFATLVDALLWYLDPNEVFIYAAQQMFIRDVCDVFGVFTISVVKGAADAAPQDALHIMHDLLALRGAAEHRIAGRLRAAVADGDDSTLVRSLVELLCSLVDQRVACVRRSLVDGLVKRCMSNLNHVSSVKRIFSSGAPMPTEPSAYLVDALKDLAQFKAAAAKSAALSESESKALVLEVIDRTTEMLTAAVKAALISAKKQQESLDKLLGRGKLKGSAADVVATVNAAQQFLDKPREKIVVQLYLDVYEYGGIISKFGVNKLMNGPYKQLLGLVEARATWLLGGCDGPEPPGDLFS